MKKLIFVIALIYLSYIKIYTQNNNWKLVDSTINSNDYYYDIKCADSLNCIIWNEYSNHGFSFRRTTDGGVTWKNIYYNSVSFLNDLAYPDTNLFIGVGSSGIILKTTNRGETWDTTIYDYKVRLGRINMMDRNYGLIAGCSGGCQYGSDLIYLETDNGGKSWEKINISFYFDIYDLEFFNQNLFCGAARVLTKESYWKTYLVWVYNHWKSFDTLNINDSTGNIYFIDDKIGWGGGGFTDFNHLPNTTQFINHTEDGGKTWTTQRNQKKNGCPIFDIKFFDENYGMATSCLGLVLMTTNGGKNWIETTISDIDWNGPLDYAIKSLQMPTKHTAYVRCSGRYVYKFTGDWPTDVPEPQKPNNFTIFPNPVESEISLSFPPEYQTSQIKIYSVEGIEVLENEYKNKIDVSKLSTGVYYIMVGDKVVRFIKL